MTKQTVKEFVGGIKKSLVKHGPEILTGIGIAGMITTTILAVRATPKALTLIEREKDRQNKQLIDEAEKNNKSNCSQISKLKTLDVVKVAWKCYIPSAVVGTASIACLIGASSTHIRRNAILATAYKLSESAFTEYKEKVIETIGEKKEQVVRDNIVKDRIEKNPANNTEIIITKKGNTKCLDMISGRYFLSDIDKIKKAVNEINARLLRESYVSLTDFYDEIGLSPSKISDKIGWNSEVGLIEIYISAVLDENEEPCIGIDFKQQPKYDFDKFF